MTQWLLLPQGVSGVSLMSHYEVFLEQAEEGGYTISCPALPGCVSEGETRAEAIANIKDAITAYLAVLKKHGLPTPDIEVEMVEVEASHDA